MTKQLQEEADLLVPVLAQCMQILEAAESLYASPSAPPGAHAPSPRAVIGSVARCVYVLLHATSRGARWLMDDVPSRMCMGLQHVA
jgi:hypothetical protein